MAYGCWDEDLPFAQYIDRCKRLQYLRDLAVDNEALTPKDLVELCKTPKLESLVVKNFKIPEDIEFTPYQGRPPANLKRLEIIRTTSLPMGPVVEMIFNYIPKLKSLFWTLETQYYSIWFKPNDISQALPPLKASLLDLHLLLVDSWGFCNDQQLDFSDFVALERLEINERFMLARNYAATFPQHCREDLFERLPPSLKTLKVISCCHVGYSF
ncbi:hypothetical protein IFR05_005295 [Cadophora sp. M221]|nr:hypothetical protein IFR05_005295 [Cadophora sp. M221]